MRVTFQDARLDVTAFQGQALNTTAFQSPDVDVRADVRGILAGTKPVGDQVLLQLSLPTGTSIEFRTSVPANWMHSSGPGFVQVSPDPSSTSTVRQARLDLAAVPSINSVTLAPMPMDSSHGVQIVPSVEVTLY